MPKAVSSYKTAPEMVHLNKPAHRSDTVFTYKTGGDNEDASVVEITLIQVPSLTGTQIKGE